MVVGKLHYLISFRQSVRLKYYIDSSTDKIVSTKMDLIKTYLKHGTVPSRVNNGKR